MALLESTAMYVYNGTVYTSSSSIDGLQKPRRVFLKLKRLILAVVLFATLGAGSLASVTSASAANHVATLSGGLNSGQQKALYSIARQTWKFFDADTDPNT